MNDSPQATTLFIALVNRNNGNKIIHAMREAGAPGCTRLAGHGYPGQAGANYMVHDVLCSLLYCEGGPLLKAAAAVCNKNKEIKMLALLAKADNGVASLGPTTPLKESCVKLIVSIVRNGKAKGIMRAARQAGATGGTLIKAQGTGTKEDVIFFGISMVPEKDMLLIVAPPEKARDIFQAVNSQPIFQEAGGGIAFALDVADLQSLNVVNGFEDWTN
jgi:Nitrogen regulatory protein PII